jgi:two-component sensor histidine kinase
MPATSWQPSTPVNLDSLPSGFGTRLAEISVVQQLGGRLHKAWDRDGLVVTISFDQARLARPED